MDYRNSLLHVVNCSNRNLDKLQRVQDNLAGVVCNSKSPSTQHQLDHCYGACTGCQSGSGSTSNSPNFVIWLYFFPTARLPCWFDQPIQSVAFAAIIHTEASVSSPSQLGYFSRRFSVAALRLWKKCVNGLCSSTPFSGREFQFGTLFHWTVELHHPLTHLRSMLRHFSLIRHNRTVARASVLWRNMNWLIDWSSNRIQYRVL